MGILFFHLFIHLSCLFIGWPPSPPFHLKMQILRLANTRMK